MARPRPIWLCLFLLASALAPASGAAGAEPGAVQQLSTAQNELIKNSCFEVVMARPEQDSPSYEKELPWDLVPFNIRNDKYASIGTAFAISNTELVTAFHVLNLDMDSRFFQRYYIRDANQQVFEIDQILACEEHRDVVRFTLKGRTFDKWLKLNPAYELNKTVFTAGNALGEGIVIRRGELIGTLPEEIDGAFLRLKSSANVNPGNSGGPLLDAAGNVIGVVVQRNDNLSFSLPTAELLKLQPGTASYYNKATYGFALLRETSKAKVSRFQFPLPLPYAAVKGRALAERTKDYRANMDQLFLDRAKELFPLGGSSQEALQDIPTSTNLELFFQDKDTSQWSISGLKYTKSDTGRNGSVSRAEAAGFAFFKIVCPDDMDPADLLAKPRLGMDMILKGAATTRTLGGQAIRITSFGDPGSTTAHQDRLGRHWSLSIWPLEFADSVHISFTTRTPEGAMVLSKIVNSSACDNWLYDMAKVLDYTYIPYTGRLKRWTGFMADPALLPAPLKAASYAFTEHKRLAFTALGAHLTLEDRVLALAPGAFLGLYPTYHPLGEGVAWDLGRVSVDESDEDNFFVLIKHGNPAEGMDERYAKGWREVARQRHPYTRKPFADKGATDIAALLPSVAGAVTADLEKAKALFTVYLSQVGTVPDKVMTRKLEALSAGLQVGPSSVR